MKEMPRDSYVLYATQIPEHINENIYPNGIIDTEPTEDEEE